MCFGSQIARDRRTIEANDPRHRRDIRAAQIHIRYSERRIDALEPRQAIGAGLEEQLALECGFLFEKMRRNPWRLQSWAASRGYHREKTHRCEQSPHDRGEAVGFFERHGFALVGHGRYVYLLCEFISIATLFYCARLPTPMRL